MKRENPGCVVVVDQLRQFLFLQNVLQAHLSPNPIIGFDDVDKYISKMRGPRMRKRYNWLIVVADFAALAPRPEKGVFSQTRQSWSNFKGIAFTADPSNDQWKQVMAPGEDIVSRAHPAAVPNLLKIIKKLIAEFGESANNAILATDNGQLLGGVGGDGSESHMGGTSTLEDKTNPLSEETSRESGSPVPNVSQDQTVAGSETKAAHDVQCAITIELDDLVQPKTTLHSLLTADPLPIFKRLLLRVAAWDLFTKLSHSDPQRLERYRVWASSPAIRETPGRKIIRDVLKHFPSGQYSQENWSDQ